MKPASGDPVDWRSELMWTLRGVYTVPKGSFPKAEEFNALCDLVTIMVNKASVLPESEVAKVITRCTAIAGAIGLPASLAADNPMKVLLTARETMASDPSAADRIAATLA